MTSNDNNVNKNYPGENSSKNTFNPGERPNYFTDNKRNYSQKKYGNNQYNNQQRYGNNKYNNYQNNYARNGVSSDKYGKSLGNNESSLKGITNLMNNLQNQNTEKWIIIDASSIIFRYFYANTQLVNSKGQNINAIHGFCRIILGFLYSPIIRGKVIVIFDGAKKNFKKNMDAAYKSKRKPLPSDLKDQLLLAEEFCMQSKIFFDKHILYEADDLIASYSHQLPGEIYIVAYDKDFLQLIDSRTFLWDYKKQTKIDRLGVFQKYGVYPENMVDFLSMVGDQSDNLSGVTGVGKVTAIKLIQKYATLENIIQNYKTEKFKFEPALKLKKIITLKKDIEIKDFTQADYIDFVKLNQFLRDLEILKMMYKTNNKDND